MEHDPVETDDLAAFYAGLWNHQGLTPESIDKDELRTVRHELSHGEHGLHWDDEEMEWVVCSPMDDCDDSLMEAADGAVKPVKAKKPGFTGMITDKRGVKRYYQNGKQVKGPEKPKPPPKVKAPKVKAESPTPADEGGLREQLKPHSHHELNDKEKASAKRSLSAYKRAHGDNVVGRLGQVAGQLQKAFGKATDEHVKEEISRKLKGIEHMLDVAKEPAAAKKPRSVKAKVAGKDVEVVSRDSANGLVKVSDGEGERVVSVDDLSDVAQAEEQGPSEDPRMKARKKQLAMGQSPLPAGFRGEADERSDPNVKALTKGSQWGRLRRISVEDKADEALAKKLTAGQFAAKLTSNAENAETLKNFYRAYRDRKGIAKNAPVENQPAQKANPSEGSPSEMVSKSIASSADLSNEQKKAYGEAASAVMAKMPPQASAQLKQHLHSAKFYPDTAKVGEGYLQAVINSPSVSPEVKDAAQERIQQIKDGAFSVSGAYMPLDKSLHMNGDSEMSSEGQYGTQMTKHHLYAHELTHVIDGVTADESGSSLRTNHSQTPEWKDVADTEIGQTVNGKAALTDYAQTNPQEGFAEFGRLLYCGEYDLGDVEKNFPKASAYFKKNQLWPQESGEKPASDFADVFDKEKRQDLGDAGHTDTLKAEADNYFSLPEEREEKPMSDEDAEAMAKKTIRQPKNPRPSQIKAPKIFESADPDPWLDMPESILDLLGA